MAAKNKFGWHSGTLKCKDAKILRDLYVQDDIVFSDVSAGVLGVTGGIDLTSTVSAIGINLTGSTCNTAQIAVGTGTSTPQTMAEAEDFALAIYTTCADTDGANTAKPLYVNAAYTGSGQVGRAAEFVLRPTAGTLMGGWCNAVKAYTDFSTTSGSGGSTGVSSAICAEMRLPKGAGAGAFYILELEYVDQSSTTFSTPGTGSQAGFIYINCQGTISYMNDNGVFMSVNGLTAAANDLLSVTSQTLKCDINQGTTRYLLLSQIQDALSLDSCATAITLGDNVTTAGIQIGNVPIGINLDGDFTDAIKIAGSNTIVDGIDIGACTTSIRINAPSTTAILMEGDAAYIPIQIGDKANTAAGGLNMNGQDSYDEHGGIMVFCDDGGVALAQTYTTSSIWTRYLITASQTSNTHTGAYLQMKSLAATYTSCDTSAAKIYFETADAVTLASGHLAVLTVSLGLGGAFTDTAEGLSGINIDINDGGDALSTAQNSAGIRIREGGTAGWPLGIFIEDSAATTAIEIGNTTTGIHFNGTLVGAIDFADATLTPDSTRTNYALGIGDRNDELAILFGNATNQNCDPIQMAFDMTCTSTGPTNASTFNGIYQYITHDTTDMTYLRIKGCDWTITTDKVCQDAYVIQTELIVSGTKTSSGELMAISALTTLGAGARTADRVCALQAMFAGSGTAGTVVGDAFVAYLVNAGTVITTDAICKVHNKVSTTSTDGLNIETNGTVTNAINIVNDSGAMTSAINLYGTITNFLNLDDAGNSGFVTTGGSDCTSSGATDPGYTIKCKMPDGGDGYIRVWDSA